MLFSSFGLIIIDPQEEWMEKIVSPIILAAMFSFSLAFGQGWEQDIIPTSEGPLKITFIGHATLMMEWDKLVIHIDPVGQFADYRQLPRADLILVTHDHGDHFDPKVISLLSHEKTVIILTSKCAAKYAGARVMANGDKTTINGIGVEAVPAYNIVHMRSQGVPYHPCGEGNGYVLIFGDKKIYIAGDTENIPEMKNLGPIDVAFLPMNLPYTMTPEMVADAARTIKPKILYPYHYGQTNPQELIELLREEKEIEVRIRNLR